LKAKFINENIKDILKAKSELLPEFKKTYEYWHQRFVKYIYKLEPNIEDYLDLEEGMTRQNYFDYYRDEWQDDYYALGMTPKESAIDFIKEVNNENYS
jgi:hypothetical protein